MDLLGVLIVLIIIYIYLIIISKRFNAAEAEEKKPRILKKVFIDESRSPEFAEEYKQILANNRELNEKYDIQFVDPIDADIFVHIVPREKMAEMHTGKVEKYVDGSRIWFSWTYQYPKPRIFIDETNWFEGVKQSGLTIPQYRQYVALHEFMHALGFDHQPCETKVCPVMYQATRGPPPGKKAGYNITPVDWTRTL